MAHLTIAASEAAAQRFLDVIVDNVSWHTADETEFGAFTAGYEMEGHLEGGKLTMRNDGSISIAEVDIRWDKIIFSLEFDISGICVGGWCVDLGIFGTYCLPQWCPFAGSGPLRIAPNLGAFIAQEVSITGKIEAKYYDHTAPDPWFDPCGFLVDTLDKLNILKGFPENRNQWHIHINPQTIDIDLFDFPDIVGEIVEDAIDAAIDPFIPSGSVGDVVEDILDAVDDVIRFALDIEDDMKEFVNDLFNITWDKHGFLLTLIRNVFDNCVPIMRIDDPYTLMKKEKESSRTLKAVKVPIKELSIEVNTDELVVQATIGEAA